MLLAPRYFVQFMDGRLGPIQTVAFVPGEYARQIGSLTSDLELEVGYAKKLMLEHDLKYEQFQLIQPAIDNGYVLKDRERPRQLIFLYVHQWHYYRLVVKGHAEGHKLWLLTLHRIKQQQLRTLLKRHILLKDHIGYTEE